MYIDLKNSFQEGFSLYRITLLNPLSFMDLLIGILLLLFFPVVILLCLLSNTHPSPEKLRFRPLPLPVEAKIPPSFFEKETRLFPLPSPPPREKSKSSVS